MRTLCMIVLALGVLALAGETAFAQVVFEDGFENAIDRPGDAEGSPVVGESWSLVYYGISSKSNINLSANANTGDKAMLMIRADYPGDCKATGNLTPSDTSLIQTNGNASFSFSILKSFQDSSRALTWAQFLNAGQPGGSVKFEDNGTVTYYDGSATTDTGLTYSVDTYQDILIDVDFSSDTFTISVEGAATSGSTDIPFWNTMDTMDAILFGAGKTCTVRYDDVLVETVGAGLDGDYNGDGAVTDADYTIWADTYQSTTDLRADGNGDGAVTDADYTIWADNYGAGSGNPAAVPEPVSVVLLAVGGLWLRRR